MNKEEQKVAEEAKRFAKSKEFRHHLIEKFADPGVYTANEIPVTILMAGSPGAGKTEFSKNFIEIFEPLFKIKIVRIDADEIRMLLPQYTGANSYVVHGAASLGVEKLYDHVLHNKQHVIIDGTFANYEKSVSNIEHSLKKNRMVIIFYIFQDPKIAWDFTIKREALEGRNIKKEVFIQTFLSARENVNKAKELYGSKVRLNLVIKNYLNKDKEYRFDISSVDQLLEKKYTEFELNNIIL